MSTPGMAKEGGQLLFMTLPGTLENFKRRNVNRSGLAGVMLVIIVSTKSLVIKIEPFLKVCVHVCV